MTDTGFNSAKSFLGVGLSFPIRADEMTGKLKLSYYEEDIQEAITIILGTAKGERVMRPEFGCDIQMYAFCVPDRTNRRKIENTVLEALQMWEPRITQVEVNAQSPLQEDGKLLILISYVVRATNNPYNMVYPFYLHEGLS
ncbi:MAG: GPW/gp25 family protein [Lachnospiraceae bacterium]|jgi:phage baseplate assembly protein W|nr:GPW/gp25 family protein [Lachnospiraceae bacterium]